MKSDNLTKIIIGVLIFVFIILPMTREKSKFTNTKSETKDIVKIDENKCSRDCCKFTQWPVPHMETKDNNNIGNNMSCNFGSASGCVCVSDDDFKYLSNRGMNASHQDN